MDLFVWGSLFVVIQKGRAVEFAVMFDSCLFIPGVDRFLGSSPRA